MQIEPVDPSYPHMSALYELLREVYTTSDSMSETFEAKFPTLETLEADIAELSGCPGALFLVAEADGHPRGYVIVKPRHQAKLRHTAELSMGVHSQARGRGLGKALVDAALAGLEQSGIVEILYLFVRADNQPAVRLYEKTGFERLARLERDTKVGDGTYYDGLLMRKFVRTDG